MVFATGKGEQLLVWLLIGFIGFFAFSQGAVIWVYLSEVFPNLVRAKGQSLGSFTHWIMNAIIAFSFPLVANAVAPRPVRLVRGDDSNSVRRGPVRVPRDRRYHAGRHAGKDGG